MKALIDGVEKGVKVVENLGFVHSFGTYAKAVIAKDMNERIVIKDGKTWRTVRGDERIAPPSKYTGQ